MEILTSGKEATVAPAAPAPALISACAVCGDSSLKKAFASVEKGFEVWCCSQCGLGLTAPPVSNADIHHYYPVTYYGKENFRFNPTFERMTHFFQRRRSRVISRYSAPGPVLEVGSGRGFLLSYLRSFGYDPHGVELSDTAAWYAQQRLRLDVKVSDFLSISYQKESFNVVVFWHSLEHLSNPIDVIAKAGEILKPGGLLVIAVPNFESLQSSLFSRFWFHLDIPRHYFHFSKTSLLALLAKNRFRVMECDHFCFEQNPYGWLQSFYNRLGFKHNLLYCMLKNKTARTTNLREHPVQILSIALLLPFFLAMSFTMTLIEAAFRRGGTIEVYAVKEGAFR